MDERIRELERDCAAGKISSHAKDVGVCRSLGHDMDLDGYHFFVMWSASSFRLAFCRRCLFTEVHWEVPPAGLDNSAVIMPRCSRCRSPVNVRKSGLCLTCAGETSVRSDGLRRTGIINESNVGRVHILSCPIQGNEREGHTLCGVRFTSVDLGTNNTSSCLRCLSAIRLYEQKQKAKVEKTSPFFR